MLHQVTYKSHSHQLGQSWDQWILWSHLALLSASWIPAAPQESANNRFHKNTPLILWKKYLSNPEAVNVFNETKSIIISITVGRTRLFFCRISRQSNVYGCPMLFLCTAHQCGRRVSISHKWDPTAIQLLQPGFQSHWWLHLWFYQRSTKEVPTETRGNISLLRTPAVHDYQQGYCTVTIFLCSNANLWTLIILRDLQSHKRQMPPLPLTNDPEKNVLLLIQNFNLCAHFFLHLPLHQHLDITHKTILSCGLY